MSRVKNWSLWFFQTKIDFWLGAGDWAYTVAGRSPRCPKEPATTQKTILGRKIRCGWESNPRIRVLQTLALPLGHRTVTSINMDIIAKSAYTVPPYFIFALSISVIFFAVPSTRSHSALVAMIFHFWGKVALLSCPHRRSVSYVKGKSAQDYPKMENCLPTKQQKTQRNVAFFVRESSQPKKPLPFSSKNMLPYLICSNVKP